MNASTFWRPDFPRLNDCVVTKQTFCIVLLRLFLIKFRCFVSTVGFSNEDNCCQLQGIGKLIKEKLLRLLCTFRGVSRASDVARPV